MVSSTSRKIFSLAISLLVVVISLTGVALGATAPNPVTKLTRYTPGFTGAPGKMARDAAGNFYVADFWGKGIVKLDRDGVKTGFIATTSRPSAVAVLPDGRLVVTMTAPQAKVAFYSQQTGAEITTGSPFSGGGTPYRPVAIAVGAGVSPYIYVLDSGDLSGLNSACNGFLDVPGTANYAKVRVYDSTGVYKYVFGARTETNCTASAAGEESKFKEPLGIAFEKQNNQVVVVDTLNGRLQFFSAYNGTACSYVSSIGATAGTASPTVGGAATFGNPVDLAFEYTGGTTLNRIYVAERGRNEIAVVDPVSKILLSQINGTTVSGGSMKLPSGILFEKTATGGVLYANDAPTATPSDILALGIDNGTVPGSPYTLTINAVPPTNPAASYSISGTVSSLNQVYCSVNGGSDIAMSLLTSWGGTVNLVAGENYILCKSSNGTATTYAEARTWGGTVGAAPTVTLLQPAAGTVYTKDATVLVSGTTKDSTGTTILPGTFVKITDALSGFTTTIQSDASGNWSAPATLAEGSNVLSVTGWALGTAISALQTRTVVADYTAPTGTVSLLANNATTVNAVQNVDGIIVDANLSSIEVNGVQVPAAAKVALSTTNTYFSVPVTLGRGANTVTVKATDLQGNTATIDSRTITLNQDLPAFTVALPADNSFKIAAGSIAANGTSAASYTLVTAGNTTATPSGGTWVTPSNMTVSNGFNSYQFTASGSGPSVSEKRTINASGTQLAITSPAADFATTNSSVLISGNVAASSPTPTISVDGGAAVSVSTYTSGTGNFSHTLTLLSQGTHVVKVTRDATTSAVRNVIYDTTPPVMSIQANAHATPSTVVGTIEPSAKISIIDAKLNGTPYTIPVSVITYSTAAGQVVWSADLSSSVYDEGSLAFTAVDPAGNTNKLFYAKGVPTGDCNGDGKVDMNDALLSLRHVAGTTVLTGIPRFQCDVGGLVNDHAAQDGDIDITDAVLILGKSSGTISF